MRPTIRTGAVFTASLGLALGLMTPVLAGPPVKGPFDVRPDAVASDVEIPNPLRGQYAWYDENKSPELLGPDHYDRMFWNEVESEDQVFDTGKIDRGLARAEATGGTYGFRVMSVCDWCSADMIVLPEPLREAEGTWIAEGGSGPLEIPDWNSEDFLVQWEELMEHLGEKYDGDPRLGYIDVGGYGNWGEWHSYPFQKDYATAPGGQTDITLESSMRVIRAVEENFPTTTVLLNTTGTRVADVDGIRSADGSESSDWSNRLWQETLALDPRIGVRNDCLGAGLEQQHAKEGLEEASRYAQEIGGHDPLQRWQTAPFVTEWCGGTRPPKDLNGDGTIEDWEYDDYNRDGVIDDWEVGSGGRFWMGLEQVEDWHVSLLSSGNFEGELVEYTDQDRADFRQANLRSGYRYQVNRVHGEFTAGGTSSVTTTWENVNVAPTYHDWEVVYELRRPNSDTVAASYTSSFQLSQVLPGTTEVTDTFDTGDLKPGNYELSVKVVDP
ncbi:MAG: DUF4832 domain-containing protein, partial [Brachybacterium sp.]|nr:DUF4832 domain-containing protein [Brachybacterium sp.]